MHVTEHLDTCNSVLAQPGVRATYNCAIEHATSRAKLGIRAEVWYSWHHTDEAGSRLVHVVTEDTRPAFDEVLVSGGRRAVLLAEVLP